MRRALKFVLVIAALLGLFGQTVEAAVTPIVAAIEAPATMPMDCIGMMHGSDHIPLPCNRMTLACIAGAGCSILFTLGVGQPDIAATAIETASPGWPVASPLEGRSVAPEPHPPSALA